MSAIIDFFSTIGSFVGQLIDAFSYLMSFGRSLINDFSDLLSITPIAFKTILLAFITFSIVIACKRALLG